MLFLYWLTIALTNALALLLGANNIASSVGTGIGAGITGYRRALIISSAGLAAGAILEGGKLSSVIWGGLLQGSNMTALGIMALSSLAVMALLSVLKVPASLSQALVGSAIGIGLSGAMVGLRWAKAFAIIVSWAVSPALALMLAALISLILRRALSALKDIFLLNWLVGWINLAATFYVAYSLGANTLGLLIGVYEEGPIYLKALLIASAIVGVLLFSRGTIRTVADNIVGISPSSALTAQIGSALTQHIFTQLGIPISLSQTIVGAILGSAITRKIVVINKRMMVEVVAGWTIAPLVALIPSLALAKAFM